MMLAYLAVGWTGTGSFGPGLFWPSVSSSWDEVTMLRRGHVLQLPWAALAIDLANVNTCHGRINRKLL
jgi:hypothetical protein